MVESAVPVLDSKVMVRCLGRLESTGLTSLIDDTGSSFADVHVSKPWESVQTFKSRLLT